MRYAPAKILITEAEVQDLQALVFELEQAFFEEHDRTVEADEVRVVDTLHALIRRGREAHR